VEEEAARLRRETAELRRRHDPRAWREETRRIREATRKAEEDARNLKAEERRRALYANINARVCIKRHTNEVTVMMGCAERGIYRNIRRLQGAGASVRQRQGRL
jgi:hypothetical protein